MEMKSKFLFMLSTLLMIACNPLISQIIEVSSSTDTFKQYEKAEFDILLKAEWTCPFNSSEIALDMVILSPSGEKLILPCYYYSGESKAESNWKARFMAQETGTYQYSFKLTINGNITDQTKDGNFISEVSDKKGILRPNNYWTFKYDNGEVFRGIGENIGWEARENQNQHIGTWRSWYTYDYMLKTLAVNGGNFFRTWMNSGNLPVDWKIVRTPGRYENSSSRFNESGIRRMDQLVELCDYLDIHFMLALETHGAFLGSGWDNNSYNVKQSGPARTPYEFFTLYETKRLYKDKLRFMVARWGYSPAIGAWEFFNEIDNVMYGSRGHTPEPLPHNIITDWHREMSEYLESTDPFGHIITTSISHRDVEGLNDLPSIDLNQKHIYRNTKSIPRVINEYVTRHNKPYAIGEFGYEWDWLLDFNTMADEKDSDFKRGLWYGLFSPTPILPLSWWWEWFDDRGMKNNFNNVREIHERMLESGNGSFEQWHVIVSAPDVEAYSVKCGNTFFVYVYNPTRESISTSINIPKGIASDSYVEIFSCDDATYNCLGLQKILPDGFFINNIVIPSGSDIVLLVST